jgi:hypothetical protein
MAAPCRSAMLIWSTLALESTCRWAVSLHRNPSTGEEASRTITRTRWVEEHDIRCSRKRPMEETSAYSTDAASSKGV